MNKELIQEFKLEKEVVQLPIIQGQKDVFISYKRENAAYVLRLYKELEKHNISAWFDLNELHQDVGAEYTKRIHDGIDNSDLFLLIYTNQGNNSVEHSDFIINEELAYAVEKNKIILFYPKDKIDLNVSRIKRYIEKIQWLDTEASAIYQPDTQEAIEDEKRLLKLSNLINRKQGEAVFEDQSLFLIRIALQRKLGKITVFGNYDKLCGVGGQRFYDNANFSIKVINKSFILDVPSKFKDRLTELNFFKKDRVQEVERHLCTLKPENVELRTQLEKFIEGRPKMYAMSILYYHLQKFLKVKKYEEIDLPSIDAFGLKEFIAIVSEMVACDFIVELEAGKTMFNGAELGVYSITDMRTENSEEYCADIQLYYSDYFTFKCMTEMYHILCSIDASPFALSKVGDIRKLSPFLCSLGLGGFLATYVGGEVSLMWTKRSGNISSGDMWHFSYDETVSLLLDGIKDEKGHLVLGKDNSVLIDANKLLLRALKEEVGATQDLVEEDNHGIFEVGVIKSERLEIELISHAVLHLSPTPSVQEQIKQMHNSANDGYLEISKVQFVPLKDKKVLIGKLLTPESYEIYKSMCGRLNENVGKQVHIGENTIIEDGCFIDDGARIGEYCKLHRNVYVGKNVTIGNNVKIQNNNSIYEGVTLENGVFVGTNVSFINERYPRSILKDGRRVTSSDWKLEKTHVCHGASIGAGAIIMCGVTIGEWAMVGAGAVVLNDVPACATVVGNPARVVKYCGNEMMGSDGGIKIIPKNK